MLSRRLPSKAPAPQPGSVSRAQFQTAMESYQSIRQPANRLEKSPRMTSSDDYSYYENTSHSQQGGGRQYGADGGGGVSLPSVHKPPVRSLTSPHRSVRRAGQRAHLPKMKSKGRGKGITWCHEDGSVNLQALADLGQRRSFPRAHAYLERLHNIHTNKSWPQPSAQEPAFQLVLEDSAPVLPIQFLDDDQLTARTRAERESFLATLLKADDLTEEDLDEIAHYFIPEDPPESPRARPETRKKKQKVTPTRSRSAKGSLGGSEAKSVRFQKESQPFHGGSKDASSPPRPHSCPPASSGRRPSDPFHVASPRSTDSSEEVAFLSGFESPPEVPTSLRHIPEPKITYYDEDGEEIEEDIQIENESAVVSGRGNASRSAKRETSSPSPTRSSPRDASTSPRPSAIESDPPLEHIPEEITPRVNRDSNPIQSDLRSHSPCDVSGDSPCPRGVTESESSNSPRRSSPPRSHTPAPRKEAASPPRSPVKLHKDSSTKENTPPTQSSAPASPQRPSRSARTERSPGPSRTERTKSPKPVTASKHPQSHQKDSRPKSAKRSKTSRSRTPPTAAGGGVSSPKRNIPQNEASGHPGQIEDVSHSAAAAAPEAEEEEGEQMPIPVFSLTRGQLPSVLSQPLRIQAVKSQPGGRSESVERPKQSERGNAQQDSLRTEGSPKSSALRGADSEMTDFERRVRMKDERMKIWLTTIAWNRHVECAAE